jgi:hypothetical protein
MKMIKDEQEIAGMVREYLGKNRFDGIGLTVIDREVSRTGEEWRVPVHPTFEPEKMSPYYEYLADIEGEIEDNEKEFVFLVPGEPMVESAG